MSYDVRFMAKLEGINEYADVINCDANITWNVKELIKQSSGWEIENEDYNGLAKDLIPKLAEGIKELTINPYAYKKYESPNGWGTIKGVLGFYQEIIKTWQELQENNKDIANVTYIYIC